MIYAGRLFMLAIAIHRGHADCGHEIQVGELYVLAPLGASCACRGCAAPSIIAALRANARACDLPRHEVAEAEAEILRMLPPIDGEQDNRPVDAGAAS